MWWLETNKEKIIDTLKKAALVGSIIDGGISVLHKRGPVDVVKDTGCGAVTSTVGSGAKMTYDHFTKTNNVTGRIVGGVASVAARYAYRATIGPKLDLSQEDDGGESGPTLKEVKDVR